jgi:hypothetical protein
LPFVPFDIQYLLLLTKQLLKQGFLVVKWKSSLGKIYSRHHDLVKRYRIPVSQMNMDLFRSKLKCYYDKVHSMLIRV